MGGLRGSCSPTLFSPARADGKVNRAPKDKDASGDFMVYRKSLSVTPSSCESDKAQMCNRCRESRKTNVDVAQMERLSTGNVAHDLARLELRVVVR